MRNILDIASWSALVLLVLSVISGEKPAPPEPPVPPENTRPAVIDEQALKTLSQSLDTLHGRIERMQQEITKTSQRVEPNNAEPTPVVTGVEWYLSLDSAWDECRRTGKPAFIHWSMDGCRPCAEMDQLIFSDPRVSRILNENFVSCKVDAKKIDRKTREGWNVTAVPTSYVVTHDWKKMRRVEPARDAGRYEERLIREYEWTQFHKEKSVLTEKTKPESTKPEQKKLNTVYYVEPYSCYPSYSTPLYAYPYSRIPTYRYSYPSYGYGGGGCAGGRCGW